MSGMLMGNMFNGVSGMSLYDDFYFSMFPVINTNTPMPFLLLFDTDAYCNLIHKSKEKVPADQSKDYNPNIFKLNMESRE